MDPFILINWKSPFPILGVSGVMFSFLIEIPVMKFVHSAASDLGLHCLHMSPIMGHQAHMG